MKFSVCVPSITIEHTCLPACACQLIAEYYKSDGSGYPKSKIGVFIILIKHNKFFLILQDKHDLCFHFLPTFWKIFQIVGNVTGWLCQLWKIINKYCVKNLEETMLNLLTSAIFQNPKPKFRVYSICH